jgi:hypothetical protein
MRGMSSVAAAGWLLLAAQAASAQGVPPATEPGTATRPGASHKPAGAPAPAAARPAPAAAEPGWSAQEIELAQARCAVLLKGLPVVAVPEGPLREGNECGAPAPMRLISIGKDPQVAFSPPPTLTCDMIAQLSKWVERDVQPLAKKFLAAPIVRIETMSSYSCRNAYGRAHGRLSEHGRANAVDIGSFVTAQGQAALVISDWGPTAREIAAAAAAEVRAAAQASAPAQRQAKGEPAPPAQPVASVAPTAEPADGPQRRRLPALASAFQGSWCRSAVAPTNPPIRPLRRRNAWAVQKPRPPAPLPSPTPMRTWTFCAPYTPRPAASLAPCLVLRPTIGTRTTFTSTWPSARAG